MDSADTESFLHMSPYITGDDDSMQLFAGLDPDSSADMMRQQNSSNFPFTFGSSLPKSEDFENANLATNVTTLSPESSLQDSISNSSNERETFGDNIQSGNNQSGGFDGSTWLSSPQNQFATMTPNFSTFDDSNQVMESHFDFDSAASSPGVNIPDTGLVNRHVAIPAEQSPMSMTSPSVEDVSNSNYALLYITDDHFSRVHEQPRQCLTSLLVIFNTIYIPGDPQDFCKRVAKLSHKIYHLGIELILER